MALMTEVLSTSLHIQTATRPIFQNVCILTAQEMTVAEVIEEKEGSNIQLGTPEPFSGQCLELWKLNKVSDLSIVNSSMKRVFFYFFIEKNILTS